jgi:hypothetical protein
VRKIAKTSSRPQAARPTKQRSGRFSEKSLVTSVGVRWALRAQIIDTKNGDIGEIATLYG